MQRGQSWWETKSRFNTIWSIRSSILLKVSTLCILSFLCGCATTMTPEQQLAFTKDQIDIVRTYNNINPALQVIEAKVHLEFSNNLTKDQIDFLEHIIATETPQAEARLQKDFADAVKKDDIRAICSIADLADRFLYSKKYSTFALETIKKHSQGLTQASPKWSLSNVSAKVLSDGISPVPGTAWPFFYNTELGENGKTGNSSFGIYPGGGSYTFKPTSDQLDLIEVTADITNLQPDQYPEYVRLAFVNIGNNFGDYFLRWDWRSGLVVTPNPVKNTDPSRLTMGQVFLIDGNGEHVAAMALDSENYRMPILFHIATSKGDRNYIFFHPERYTAGETKHIQMVFAVKQGKRDHKLLLLGSSPITLPYSGDAPQMGRK